MPDETRGKQGHAHERLFVSGEMAMFGKKKRKTTGGKGDPHIFSKRDSQGDK